MLDELLGSIAASAHDAGVPIVALDTQVVAGHDTDEIHVTASAVGSAPRRPRVHPEYIAPGDVILVNGPVAEHGIVVALARETSAAQPTSHAFRSDVAPLNVLIARVLKQALGVVFTAATSRGGVAGACARVAARTGQHVRLDEVACPVHPEVRRAAEMLGLDTLHAPNAGKVLFFVRPRNVEHASAAARADPRGTEARAIGEVGEAADGTCELVTITGSRRILCDAPAESFCGNGE